MTKGHDSDAAKSRGPERPRRPRAGSRLERVALVTAALAGVAMLVIGLRFLVSPRAASHFFGVGSAPEAAPLQSAIGLRDLWVGGLALAFAALREWRALALWFGFGGLVCFGDALIVARTTGATSAIAFHTLSGVVCLAIAAIAIHRLTNRQDPA